MASFQAAPTAGPQPGDRLPDELVSRVAAAAGKVAQIEHAYSAQVEATSRPEARNALATQARLEAEQALDDQGLSIDDYNAVLTAAENDKDLERRLVDAVRESY